MIVTGTVFPHKATWSSPDGRTKNQMISRQHRSSMLDTRVIRAADVGSDHYLVRRKIRLKLKAKRTIQPTRSRFKNELLEDPKVKAKFVNTVTTKINDNGKKRESSRNKEETIQEVEEKWKVVKESHFRLLMRYWVTETTSENHGSPTNHGCWSSRGSR